MSHTPDSSLEQYTEALAAGIESALPGWVVRSVKRVMVAWSGAFSEQLAAAALEVGVRAASDVGGEVRRLLAADVDDQPTTPLELVRSAVRYPTAVLVELGVPAVERDEFSTRRFPEDVYDLTPASLADVDPSLGEIGIVWGA
ncbi:MAG TPA: hypothetical protein VFV02_10435, partial [Acidimicrobiales bacterium]|nr:hypothetical protein [Acidimicrobiales bacterium]